MIYFPTDDISVINPDETINLNNGILIEDAYELLISYAQNSKIVVREVAGRILQTKRKWRLSFADVHMYSDGSLCICPEPEEKLRLPNGFNIRDFFNHLLIPYLYYQSYLNKYGKEPWKSSSHGELGILESYGKYLFRTPSFEIVNQYLKYLTPTSENTILNAKPLRPNDLCLCHSGKNFLDCHNEAFEGYKKLFSDYISLRPKRRYRHN
jgi:hypothetical protein